MTRLQLDVHCDVGRMDANTQVLYRAEPTQGQN